MSLEIKSFGNRLSFEIVRDGVTVGGLAYASKIRSPRGNGAFATGTAHIYGEDIEIEAQKTNAKNGPVEFEIEKDDEEIGLIRMDWRGKTRIGLSRVDGGRDDFRLYGKASGRKTWFQMELNNNPILQLRPLRKYSLDAYHFRVDKMTRRIPDRVVDELCIYAGFAANVYMARMVE